MKITQESINNGTADWDNQMNEILNFIKTAKSTEEEISTFICFFFP
jgi:hypothetical protein